MNKQKAEVREHTLGTVARALRQTRTHPQGGRALGEGGSGFQEQSEGCL